MTGKPTKADTRFKPGQSGNPRGRPRLRVASADLRAKLSKDADLIIDSVVQAALCGDTQAARLVLERIIPAIKPTEQAVAIPMLSSAPLTEQGRAVLAAVADGRIAPGQGAVLLNGIGTLARVAEIDELTRRIEALEAHGGPQKN